MDSEGIVKSVDGIYKNILDKFNPGAKQLIASSKSYLKNLQSTSAASKVFIESLAKLAVNAHEGGTTDIGTALMDLVGVFSSIEDQHMNILKAFYVDFIVPLESNLDKDTKVVQHEQKKFVQLHKQRIESFNKATSAMKKHRKKKNNAEKELKCIQALEEEKKLLDNFCDQSIKNALIQERRRYGFVLERCVQSLAKHWSQYFEVGHSSIQNNMAWWNETAETREMLPTNPPASGPKKPSEQRDLSSSAYDEYGSVKSAMRKSQSINASTGSLRDAVNNTYQTSRPRAMSEHSLASSPPQANNLNAAVVTALYAYLSSGENQLSFFEGDKIILIGEKTQGWQFGENMRTSAFGWFPISYVHQDIERKPSFRKSDEEVVESISGSRSTLKRNQEPAYQKEPSLNRYQKLENPPSSMPPPPPSSVHPDSMRLHGSATANFSKAVQKGKPENKPSIHAIYSSNDSGFSNELPPAAPEVDYSDDDDMPRKIPIREPSSNKSLNATSDTEDVNDNFSKSSINLKQSNSFGNLTGSPRNLERGFNIDSATMKKNKSFWRLSKSEDILEGMALWKHRDLMPIDAENNDKEMTLKKNDKPHKKMDTLQRKNSRIEEPIKKMDTLKNNANESRELRNRAQSFNNNFNREHNNNFMHRDDDEIYDESPKKRNDIGPNMMGPSKAHSQVSKFDKNNKNKDENFSRDLQDTNFYDDDVMVIKTVKRKEILKQYYSSGTDTELSSSDPYDCIIVDDHLVPQASTSTFRNRNSYAGEPDKRLSVYSRSNKNDVSGTLLPRTKLSKSNRVDSNEPFDDRMNTKSSKTNKSNNFGQWNNLWPDE